MMVTVADLIERLKDFPPTATVMVESKNGGGFMTDVDWCVHFYNEEHESKFSVVLTDFPTGEKTDVQVGNC